MKTVVLGFLGSTLDRGFGDKRWDRWRPTIGIGQQEDLLVDRLELLHVPAPLGVASASSACDGLRSKSVL